MFRIRFLGMCCIMEGEFLLRMLSQMWAGKDKVILKLKDILYRIGIPFLKGPAA